MTDDEIERFNGFICVGRFNTATSERTFERIRSESKVKVTCITCPIDKKRNNRIKIIKQKQFMDLFIGYKRMNINYCGLFLFVRGISRNVLFTGDGTLLQASEKILIENEKAIYPEKHYLVVPHHGEKLESY
ncbi:MAG: hypothetical protein J6J09_10630 [Phocaeicola sp.]|nr:hypothetical protein [Phocaeicola sp.]